MAIDFNKPAVGDLHASQYTPGIRDALRALGKQLDGEGVSNAPVGTMRFSSANGFWQVFNGSAWVEVGTAYLKSSSYTAADVLAKLLTVDGIGSGLDAALLGGAGPAFFTDIPARLGYVPFSAAGGLIGGAVWIDAGLSDAIFVRSGGSFGVGNPYFSLKKQSPTVLQFIGWNGSALEGQLDILIPLVTIGGHAVWHAGNFTPANKANVASPNFTGTPQHNGVEIGYRSVPRSTTTGTAVAADRGRCIALAAGLTIPAGVFAAGDAVSLYNDSAAAVTITQGSGLTLRLVGTSTTGNRTLAARGLATVWFNSANEAVISGGGLT
ncbi:hypothetical protein [Arenimonas sp.]|uniref:hypothetical protein n=1 Tax=Arenimonas sp. TaxID=1872635 RepID=UPI0025B8A2B6|nr:hypothetical protein [Arenimonas sp.]